jgi:hypothetical protein
LYSASFNYPEDYERFVLHSTVEFLKRKPLKPDTKSLLKEVVKRTPKGIQGEILVALASENKHEGAMQLLLESGVNPNTPSRENQETAIARARGNGCSKIVKLLQTMIAKWKFHGTTKIDNRKSANTHWEFFCNQSANETYYAFSIDDGLLKINSLEQFDTTLASYQQRNPAKYKSTQEVDALKFNPGDWGYTLGEFLTENQLEQDHAQETMEEAVKEIIAGKLFSKLKTTKDFKGFVNEHKYWFLNRHRGFKEDLPN